MNHVGIADSVPIRGEQPWPEIAVAVVLRSDVEQMRTRRYWTDRIPAQMFCRYTYRDPTYSGSTVYGLFVPEMDRRSLMLMTGLGLLAAAMPIPLAQANPLIPDVPHVPDAPPAPGQPPVAPPAAALPGLLFSDEFDGPAGSAPDPSKWAVAQARELIKNPVFWDRPENMGQYRDDRQNVFLDGNSNLVLRAIREGDRYVSGKVAGLWRGAIGTTWEARIKFECLAPGAWPAWWLVNDNPVNGGEVDLIEWYGNGEWPSGSTVHSRLDGTSSLTQPMDVDPNWHNWRATWDNNGMYFWKDYVDGAEPFFRVPARSMDPWPFNDPGFSMTPMLNLAVSGSGGGDPGPGNYPAQMLVDWVRVW
jgi:beta-glucanase (GH16 family)